MRHELLSRYLASTPAGCDAVISALGHNLTLRGMYGAPRKLCTDTVSQLCRVAEMLQPARPIRLIAISTEGARASPGTSLGSPLAWGAHLGALTRPAHCAPCAAPRGLDLRHASISRT